MSSGTSPSHADAWVTHLGREMRAQYRAQSPDGQFFLMKFSGDRASSIRWFDFDDVEFIRPIDAVYVEPSTMVRNRLERVRAAKEAQAPEAEA